MLLDTYKMFCKANENMLKDEILKINDIIKDYRALELIRKPLSNCISSGLTIPQTLDEIEKSTLVSKKVAKELISKYKISKLLTFDTETTNLENNLKHFKISLKNLNKYLLEQYNGTIK